MVQYSYRKNLLKHSKMAKNAAKTEKGTRGSVLFYILLAVALFAALSYAVSRMMRGAGNIGDEKAGIYAAEVTRYGGTLHEAVRALRISNGCTEDLISFEKAPFDGSDASYVNSASPSDFSCHIFHPSGGGVGYLNPLAEVNDSQDWVVTGRNAVPDVGDNTAPELVAILPDVTQKICLRINEYLGVENPGGDPPSDADNVDLTPFIGVYSLSEKMSTSAQLSSHMAGCYKHTQPDPPTYNFYQVLIPR